MASPNAPSVLRFLLLYLMHYRIGSDIGDHHPNRWLITSENRVDSMNFQSSYDLQLTGRNVVIGISDSHINFEHPDLQDLQNSELNREFKSREFENHLGSIKHGTFLASIIGGRPRDYLCSPGLAYGARIALIKTPFGKNLNFDESEILKYKNDEIDIYLLSWGVTDDGKSMGYVSPKAHRAMERATNFGRNGRGNVFITSSGNGGENFDDCNCDGYTSSLYTITVGMYNSDCSPADFQEHCSAMLVTVPNTYRKYKLATFDDDNDDGVSEPKCSNTFTGTSASAPIISSAVALTLEANPNLTWRDVQYLIVQNSTIDPKFEDNIGISENAAGLRYSSFTGFGKLDVGKMTSRALTWINVPPVKYCKIYLSTASPGADDKNARSASEVEKNRTIREIEFHVMDESKCRIGRVESVVFQFSGKCIDSRSNISIELISPSQTKSNILSRRYLDRKSRSFKSVALKSVHFWGEGSKGVWRVRFIYNGTKKLRESGEFINIEEKKTSLLIQGY